ncbi:uncharacterized protein I206_104278 [Kwoniella pini CBS 10737]|uniref:Uncharacterized protein n=1 Tax=Kwoniella pini CBS 10737 TaxID=1296096 RepID=A0A1B9I277_9TREE|nr:uncharacterized protein I206_04146 [Kwoniella pini CBS 10737]OCF49624.1 hypothetical protein I206_04146 [Kwoniella pini CBS 10737]
MLKLFPSAHGLLFIAYLTTSTAVSHEGQIIVQSGNSDIFDSPTLFHQDHGTAISHEKKLFYDIDDIQYFTPYDHPIHTSNIDQTSEFGVDNCQPVVIIPISIPVEGIFTIQHLKPMVERYFSIDDVLTAGFFKHVMFYGESNEEEIPVEMSVLVYLMRQFKTEQITFNGKFTLNLPAPGIGLPSISIHKISSSFSKTRELGQGPYLMRYQDGVDFGGEIEFYPVFKLYSDYYKTFVNGIYPIRDGNETYKTLNKVDKYGNLLIPVPSRLCSENLDGPLRGDRMAVKDIYDIKGIPTSAGSRVFEALRGDVNVTASSVLKLDREGSVIVGKVKTTAPFSPRADQYQSCSYSSSGSACAVAAYDWLDFAIATDSGGSIRGPAGILGLYGNKPTRGLISMDGITPSFNWTDTPGILIRSPWKLKKVLEVWYGNSQANRRFNHLPKTLLVPTDDLGDLRHDIKKMVYNFLYDTERTFGMKVKMINQTDNYQHVHRNNKNMMTLRDFHRVNDAWSWKYLGKSIVEGYQHLNQGRFPPVGTNYMNSWKKSRENPWSNEDFVIMKNKQIVFSTWFNSIIGRDEETCSKSVYIEPMGLEYIPSYRESKLNYKNQTFLPYRKSPLYPTISASISGAPHYVVPIGQVSFKSTVSDKEEMQTISMSLMTYPGCDFMLLDFINKLAQVGILQEVKTGRTAF